MRYGPRTINMMFRVRPTRAALLVLGCHICALQGGSEHIPSSNFETKANRKHDTGLRCLARCLLSRGPPSRNEDSPHCLDLTGLFDFPGEALSFSPLKRVKILHEVRCFCDAFRHCDESVGSMLDDAG